MRYLIKNGLVLAKDITKGFYKANIAVDGDIISFIGSAVPTCQFDEVIDAQDCIVIPGLVNAHLHSHDHFNKCGFDNLPLELWMTLLRPFFSGILATKDEIYLRTLYGCIEMLKTGTTAIIDDIVQTPYNDEEKLDAIMRAYKKAGIRASVTSHIGNKPIEDTIPYLKEGYAKYGFVNSSNKQPDAKDIIAYAKSKLNKYNTPGAVQRYAVAPSGPQRCTDELITGLTDLAKTFRVPAVIHTLETYTQKKAGDYFFKKTLVRRLYDLGALNEYVNLIHCVWVTDDDIELIRKTGAKIVHNPSSNLKLGSGIAPVRKFINAGIPVGIGTDNTSSNDSINLFFEMRASGLIHKIFTKDYKKWVGANEALQMGTIGGAECAGLDKEIGTIEAGKKADLVVLETKNEKYMPLNDYVKHLVFAENGSSVKHVFINGDMVLKDKKIMTFDEREVIDEISSLLPKIHSEQEQALKEASELMKCLEYAYERANEDRQ